MRKFTLLIALLFVAIGAMAQITANTATYTIKSVNRGYIYYDHPSQKLFSSSFKDLTDATPSGANNEQFAFLRTDNTPEGEYYIYCIAAEKFVTYTGTNGRGLDLTSEPVMRWTLEANGQYYVIKVPNQGNLCINITNWDAVNGCKVIGTAPDDGNKMTLVKVNENADFNAAIAKIQAYEGVDARYQLVDQAGNVYEGNFTYNGSNTPSVSGAYGYSLIGAEWNATELLYTATINFPYPVSKVGGATNETLLSQFDSNKFWHADGNSVKVQTVSVKAIDANCLWAIYPSFNNGAFTFAIMNVATGKYIHTDATATAHNTVNTITLSDTPTMFTIASEKDWKVYDKNLYISINSSGDTNVWLGVYGNAHGGTNVTAVALPQYEVAVTEAKFATFYAPVAVEVPAGVTAHTVTINGKWAVLSEEALEVIPAYTGVVLYSETPATYTFLVKNEQIAPIESNVLDGTVAATYITKEAYVLGIKDGVVGFYTATTTGQTGGTFLNNHHKAYLLKSKANGAAYYSFCFGEGTTGVEEVKTENGNVKTVYDLTGRRVEEITAPGIYIVGGKKVLVK